MPEMTWQEMVEVARFLQLRVIDLQKVPVRCIEQALAIVRAKVRQ